ncbi:sugar phosphate isomerase/epimerase [Cetobacterium somerae]|mgnify:CR=1 FL=1|uniref:sugar phosphate isomerase/epimerase family protein n=1 Tax=Cetobacterium somerae TaxID=188913 RepID=UPI00211E5EF8|nr:sugar phosphate isomerase/epimerase [Cetobacterium somerae]
MKIAVQMIGYFMPYLKEGKAVELSFAKEALKNAKEMGYDGVQLSGFGRVTNEIIDFYRDTCKELGLKIVATHINYLDLTENLDLVIKAHKEWNCDLCGIGAMPINYQGSYEKYIEFANIIDGIGKSLLKENIFFMYHMHAFEFMKFNNKFGLEILMENTSIKNVKLLIDTYWAQYGGVNILALIDRYSDRINTIHLKDMKIISTGEKFFDLGKQVICPLGEGNIDFKPIVEKIKKLKIDWIIIEQDYSLDNDINGDYKKSLDFLKKIV